MSISVEDVLANPHKYGFPTIQEFAANPDKYRESLSKRLARVDQSSAVFKNSLERQTYKIAGFKVKTLEEVERIAREEGINLADCNFAPQVLPGSMPGKVEIMVEFKVKTTSKLLDLLGRPFKK